MRRAHGRRQNVVSISFPGATPSRSSRLVQGFLLVFSPWRDPLGTGAQTLGWSNGRSRRTPVTSALAGLLRLRPRGRRTNRAERAAQSAPGPKMREPARRREKSAGPLSNPSAWFSSLFGPLAFGLVIVSRAWGLSPCLQLFSLPRSCSIFLHAGGSSLHYSSQAPRRETYSRRRSLRAQVVCSLEAPRLGPGAIGPPRGARRVERARSWKCSYYFYGSVTLEGMKITRTRGRGRRRVPRPRPAPFSRGWRTAKRATLHEVQSSFHHFLGTPA